MCSLLSTLFVVSALLLQGGFFQRLRFTSIFILLFYSQLKLLFVHSKTLSIKIPVYFWAQQIFLNFRRAYLHQFPNFPLNSHKENSLAVKIAKSAIFINALSPVETHKIFILAFHQTLWTR
jgi:hypothetical protein